MEIKWSHSLLTDLRKVVNFIKTSDLGEVFEDMYNFFIEKHSQYGSLDEYYMRFLDAQDPNQISEGEYRLAFLCQIVNVRNKRFHNPYKCLSYIITYSIKRYWSVSYLHNSNTISYVVSILSELWPQGDKKTIYNSVLIVKNCINQKEKWSCFGNLYTECEIIDLSILPVETRRNILQILEINKTFYLRLLLLVVQNSIKQNINWEKLSDIVKFSKEQEMLNVLKFPPVILAVIVTGFNLKKRD